MSQTRDIPGQRRQPVTAAAAAILLALLATSLPAAEPEEDPKPALTEKISFPSPDGEYALRIMYDAAAHKQMTGEDVVEDGDVDSDAIHGLAIVSLPDKKIMNDFADITSRSGNVFGGPQLLWSSDSRWCAFYQHFPRISHTHVYYLAGDRFKLAHKPDDLDVPSKGAVRNVYIAPVSWVKPGVLELSVERVYRGKEPSDDLIGFTASFDGKGKWRVLKKKR